MHKKDDPQKDQGSVEQGRRDFLKGSSAVAGGVAATAVTGASTARAADCEPSKPYGDRPGGGISLPEHHPIAEFLDKPLRELVQSTQGAIDAADKERHAIYAGALAAIIRRYWCGNKYGMDGSYPRNPDPSQWAMTCPYLGGEYRGHNIAALAVDHDGYIIDFDFNHNQLFDSSAEHAEARLIRRVFSLTQLQDSWNVASEDNKPDKYGDALSRVTVYTSLESCTQCTGIMMLGRVKRVVYLQSDPGMYRIGDFLHTLTSRKEKEDFIRAPEPISASRVDLNILRLLDAAFDAFQSDIETGDPFYIAPDGRERRSKSITSFLSTETALRVFSDAADSFSAMSPIAPKHRPRCEEDTDACMAKKMTNEGVLREARQFVDYANDKGHRGTPHR